MSSAHNKDGTPTIPICVDCKWFRSYSGIGSLPNCATPRRKGDFDLVYGWIQKQTNPYDARNNQDDCGTVGNYYEKEDVGKVVEEFLEREKIYDREIARAAAKKVTRWGKIKIFFRDMLP